MADVPPYAPLSDDADLVRALADVVNEGRHLWYGDYKAQSEAELDAIRFIIDRTREAQRLIDQRQLRAAPRSGVGCWVAREDPRLGADAKPDPYKRVILSRDLGDLLNLAPGECARVRITREEA